MNRLMSPLLFAVIAMAACADTPPSTDAEDARLSINVGALELPGVTDARYSVTVTNGPGGAGDTVWSQTIDSAQFGDGAGSVAYVGTCDAATGTNSVTLVLEDLYGAGGAVLSTGSYENPTPVTQDVLCEANRDVAVTFNLAILRQANQGFFDVAVSFEDVFCSAKLDCVRDGGTADLDLLHNPATGERDLTAVMGFACTAGAAGDTFLYLNDPVISCDGLAQNITFDITGQGTVDLTANTTMNVGDYLFGAAVYRGAQPSLSRAFWNVSFGLDEAAFAGAGNCTLVTRGTASSTAFPETPQGFPLPANTAYPVIDWNVQLSDADGRICEAHAVNDGLGVATTYVGYQGINLFTWGTTPVYFRHRYDQSSDTVASAGCPDGSESDGSSCVDIDECASGTDNCAANATCTDIDGGFTCACDTGFTGDGVTCDNDPNAPEAFAFAPQTGVAQAKNIISEAVVLTGFTGPVAITFSGNTTSAAWSIDDGDTWITNLVGQTISPTSEFRLRQRSGDPGETTVLTVTIGSGAPVDFVLEAGYEYRIVGDYTFTVPDGVTSIEVVVIGGGGSGVSCGDGGDSFFGTVLAEGGTDGARPTPGQGGGASGGDVNYAGGDGGVGGADPGTLRGAGGGGGGGAGGGGGGGAGGGIGSNGVPAPDGTVGQGGQGGQGAATGAAGPNGPALLGVANRISGGAGGSDGVNVAGDGGLSGYSGASNGVGGSGGGGGGGGGAFKGDNGSAGGSGTNSSGANGGSGGDYGAGGGGFGKWQTAGHGGGGGGGYARKVMAVAPGDTFPVTVGEFGGLSGTGICTSQGSRGGSGYVLVTLL